MEKLILTAVMATALAALSSCSGTGAYISVLRGNHSFSQGSYQDANVRYLAAAETGLHPAWISYNIGTLYHSLGEPDAAESEWERAAATDSPKLLFLVLFNYGVHLFETGRYDEAYASFRRALELEPTDMDTKVNLEYCLIKIDAQGSSRPVQEQRESQTEDPGQEVKLILDYVRRKEGERWQSTEILDTGEAEEDW